MLKRLISIALVFSLLFLLPSCHFDITELSDRLIIEAIGVDISEKGWKISVQVLDTKQSGSSADSESKEEITQVYTGEGSTVAQAMDLLMIMVGQEALYSQTRILIIGKKAAEEDISQPLDYFLREYTTRDDTFVAIAYDKAEDIVSAKLGEATLGARIIEHEIETGSSNGLCVEMPMYRFVNLLTGETDAAYAPVIKSEKVDEKTDKLIIYGTALFSDFKLKTMLNVEQTTGLMFINDLIVNCVLSLELDNGTKTAVEVIKSDTDINILSQSDKITADIGCRLSCDIIEFSNKHLEELTSENIREIETKSQEKVLELMKKTYDLSVTQAQCDIARLGRRLWRKHPELYADYISDKDSSLGAIEAGFTVKIKMRRAGKETFEN